MSESQEEDGKGALPHPYHPLHPPRPVSARPGGIPGGGSSFPWVSGIDAPDFDAPADDALAIDAPENDAPNVRFNC